MPAHLRKFLRLRAVKDATGLPTSTLYEMMDRDKFPRPIKLGARAVGWDAADIAKWQEERLAASKHEAA